jgi:hypothetical protein
MSAQPYIQIKLKANTEYELYDAIPETQRELKYNAVGVGVDEAGIRFSACGTKHFIPSGSYLVSRVPIV